MVKTGSHDQKTGSHDQKTGSHGKNRFYPGMCDAGEPRRAGRSHRPNRFHRLIRVRRIRNSGVLVIQRQEKFPPQKN